MNEHDQNDRRSPQRQARALGDPTRHAIFRHVEQADGPVGVAELTEHFALNHNTIRQHLARLCDAGLLLEGVAAPNGPGRRRLEYRPAPGAGAWGSVSPYQQLSLLLLDVIRSRRSPRDVGRAAGRELAERADPATSVVDELEQLAEREGFDPRRVGRRGAVDLVLQRCPFADAASVDPETVCELHRGIAEGATQALGGEPDLVELTARDPRRAECRLRIQSPRAP